jgi:hypothetical protein
MENVKVGLSGSIVQWSYDGINAGDEHCFCRRGSNETPCGTLLFNSDASSLFSQDILLASIYHTLYWLVYYLL